MSRAATAIRAVLAGNAASGPACLACIAGGAGLHGLALGASSGSAWLSIDSAIKVPLLLLAASVVTVPNFYVLHAVLGLAGDFRLACRGLLAAQATLALALGGFAPIVVMVWLSTSDGYLVTVLDGLLFAVAVGAAQVVLRRHYAPLLERNPRHRVTLTTWALLYVFFAVHLAWVLRPFLGTPGLAIEFLRKEAFEQNAYVVLVQHVVRLFR